MDANLTQAEANTVDTYNWDAVFAITYDAVNPSLTSEWSDLSNSVKTIQASDPSSPGYEINGTWQPWQLTTGGDGKLVRMICTFASGAYTYNGQTFDLSSGTESKPVAVLIELGLQWLPQPGQTFFTIEGASTDQIIADLNSDQIDAALQSGFTANGITLGVNATANVVSLGKVWCINDGETYYEIFLNTDKNGTEYLLVYGYATYLKTVLQALANAAESGQPAVTVVQLQNVPSSLGTINSAIMSTLLSEWFTENLEAFTAVFSELSLAPTLASSPNYAWLAPTGQGYAVVDTDDSSTSYFGVLTTALQRQVPPTEQLSPNAIPTDCDASFLISGPNVVQEMLLPSAASIFNGEPLTSFTQLNDGLTVTNNAPLVWGKFMLDNKKKGTVSASFASELDQGGAIPSNVRLGLEQIGIYPPSGSTISVTAQGQQWLISNNETGFDEYILNMEDGGAAIDVYIATIVTVDTNKFTLTLVDQYVNISFVDVTIPYDYEYNVYITFNDSLSLGLRTVPQTTSDQPGTKQIFTFTGTRPSMTVVVKKTSTAVTVQAVTSIMAACLGLIAVAGPILEGLTTAVDVGEVTTEEGEALLDAEKADGVLKDNPEGAEENNEDAGEQALSQSKGRLTNIKNAFNTTHWKIFIAFTSVFAAVTGTIVGGTQLLGEVVEGNFENVPAFDDFANAMIAPYSFPAIADYTLKSAALNGSMVVGFTVDNTAA